MVTKAAPAFLFSAGLLFFITAAAKLVSSFGTARILETPDPIFGCSFRDVFRIVGLTELAVSIACFLVRGLRLRVVLVAWLATGFLLYRAGLILVGYHRPCSCLGNLTDAIHIPPMVADNIMKGILAYLLIGSYALIFQSWLKKEGNLRLIPLEEANASKS